MVLAMRHGVMPASLYFDEPSGHVDWSTGAVSVLSQARPWPAAQDHPRRAGVSSFGISGTNAHVILEQAPPETTQIGDQSRVLVGGEEVADSGVGSSALPWVISAEVGAGVAAQAGRWGLRWMLMRPWTRLDVGIRWRGAPHLNIGRSSLVRIGRRCWRGGRVGCR